MIKSGSTAAAAAAARAQETVRFDGILVDPYAARLASSDGILALAELGGDSLAAAIAVRTRWFDDRVQRSNARTIVTLGAGLDTRPWRLPMPGPTRWIEVDRVGALERKRACLPTLPRRQYLSIAADVRDASTFARIHRAIGRDTPLFVLEGLLGYLDEGDVKQLLRRIASAGGRAIFDVVESAAAVDSQLAHRDEPWCFTTNDPRRLIAAVGLDGECIELGSPLARYGRWPDRASVVRRARSWVVATGRWPQPPDVDPTALFVEADHPCREDDIRRYRDLLRARDVVLEVGAGAGGLAMALAPSVQKVFAVENNRAHLRVLEHRLRRAPRSLARRIEVLEHDIRQPLRLATKPTIAIVAYNTLLELRDREGQRAALRTIAGVLTARGRLALDVVNPTRLGPEGDRAVRRDARRVTELGSYVRYVRASGVDADDVQSIEGWYEHGYPPLRSPFSLRVRHLSMDALRSLLEDNGFALTSVEGDVPGQPWSTRSERTFVVATRRPRS